MANLFNKKKKASKENTPQARPEKREVPRLFPDPNAGLTAAQVQQRIDAGQQNFDNTPATRTEKQIVIRNICTLFNLVNIIIFIAILAVGSVKDTLFMAIVAANTAIGIIQEIRAKRSIDKLSFLTAAKAKVIRDGQTNEIPIEEIVLDDIIILSAGDQVPTDSVVVKATPSPKILAKRCWPAASSSAAASMSAPNASVVTTTSPKSPLPPRRPKNRSIPKSCAPCRPSSP